MKRRLLLLFFITMLSLSLSTPSYASSLHKHLTTTTTQQNHTAIVAIAKLHHGAEAERSVTITLKNRTGQTLYRSDWALDHGEWGTFPPETINDHDTATFESQSDGFATGTEGHIYYWIGNTGQWIWLYWDNPYVGSNSYNTYVSDSNYEIDTIGDGSGNNSGITFRAIDR